MRKLLMATAAITALSLLPFEPAQAISNAEADCLAQGDDYVYTKVGPTATCTGPEEKVGNQPPHSNGQTTQTTEVGQGNLKKSEPVCEGPPGQCK